jgi:hypothetical protein
MMSNEFPWFFQRSVVQEEDLDEFFQFSHIFLGFPEINRPVSSSIKRLDPVFTAMELQYGDLVRVKANLLTKTSQKDQHGWHTDHLTEDTEDVEYWTAIFYINTNDGVTRFKDDGTEVSSIENRMVKFPMSMQHTGTSCTDKKSRVVLNINYKINKGA